MDAEHRYISLYLSKVILERIDEYRFEKRFISRTEAIRDLIEKSLPPDRNPRKKK
jgi:metal-responsive CopG/Arc/MetJ family transcriptional regulator